MHDLENLDSHISADSNIEKEITTRIIFAAQAFNRLKNSCRSLPNLKYTNQMCAQFSYLPQKPREPTLRSRASSQASRGDASHRILRFKQEHRAKSKEISRLTGINIIVEEEKQRRRRRLGRVPRIDKTKCHTLSSDGHHQEEREASR